MHGETSLDCSDAAPTLPRTCCKCASQAAAEALICCIIACVLALLAAMTTAAAASLPLPGMLLPLGEHCSKAPTGDRAHVHV